MAMYLQWMKREVGLEYWRLIEERAELVRPPRTAQRNRRLSEVEKHIREIENMNPMLPHNVAKNLK